MAAKTSGPTTAETFLPLSLEGRRWEEETGESERDRAGCRLYGGRKGRAGERAARVKRPARDSTAVANKESALSRPGRPRLVPSVLEWQNEHTAESGAQFLPNFPAFRRNYPLISVYRMLKIRL